MEAWAVVVTLALFFFPAHLFLTQNDWLDLRRWISSMMQKVQDAQKEARLEEEMWKLRQRNFIFISRCICHLNIFMVLGMLHEAVREPGFDSILWTSFCTMGYVQHLMVACGFIELTRQQQRLLTCFLHFMCLVIMISTAASATAFKFAMMQAFQVGLRFWLVIMFLDPWVSIPFQLLFTLAEMLLGRMF
eukprot:g11333.t1